MNGVVIHIRHGWYCVVDQETGTHVYRDKSKLRAGAVQLFLSGMAISRPTVYRVVVNAYKPPAGGSAGPVIQPKGD